MSTYPRRAEAERIVRASLWREVDPLAAMCARWPMIPRRDLEELVALALELQERAA